MSYYWVPPWGIPASWTHPRGYPFTLPAQGPVRPAVVTLPAARPSTLDLSYRRMAWSPDSRYLLYVGARDTALRGQTGPLMLLDLAQPGSPRPVAAAPWGGGVAWHPDGQSFVYIGAYQDPEQRMVPTIFQKRPGDAEPVNLLTPDVTVPLKVAFIHRWLDDRTLAFDEGVGTGLRRVLLLDTAEGKLIENPELVGSYFTWSAAGDRLAGEFFPWPPPRQASFWLWDRRSQRFLLSAAPEERRPLPGNQQFFEAWSPDGRSLLFTAWDQFHYELGAKPTLYRLNPETGRTDMVADNAALAAWSGDWIAYVRWGPRLTLVVTRAADNQVLWTDDLGPVPERQRAELPGLFEQVFPWTYWPRFAGPYVAYRTTAGEWRVSRATQKDVRPIYEGESVDLLWSPDGRHIALLHTNELAYLSVVANPFPSPSPWAS